MVAEGREQLRRPVMFSATGHAALATGLLIAALLRGTPVIWGEAGGGAAASVSLVSAASVPLPAPAVPTQNRVATENKGLHYTEPPKPAPKPPTPPPEEKAVAIPAKDAKVTPPKPPAEEQPPEEKPQAEEPPQRRRKPGCASHRNRLNPRTKFPTAKAGRPPGPTECSSPTAAPAGCA